MSTKPGRSEAPSNQRVDDMLSALASVVVDELIRLKKAGMTPEDIKQLYVRGLPKAPAVPVPKNGPGEPPRRLLKDDRIQG